MKKKLALCITLSLLLSGCGMANENQYNTNIDVSSNGKITSDSTTEKPIEDLKSSDKEEDIPKVKSDLKVESNSKTESESKVESTPKEKSTSTQKPTTTKVSSNISSLSTKAIGWSWLYSTRDSAELLSKYKAYGFGDTSKKIIYLTFDEGYENGYTDSILDTLKANNVHATFFVTKPYVTGSFNGASNTYLLKRMSNEGHIIGNHSVHHKSMPTFTDEAAFNSEITQVEDAVNNVPGCKMSKYFRPPEGTFSELSLYYTQKLGYKSIFFTLAYKDYDVDNQPDPASSKAKLLKNTRDGMICLLHAVSKTNATILDSLIKDWKSQGYEFKTLDELPS
ncbi:polysaccharide deacetylase family protein [Clostridium taeniosporum]|uniref:polysaccharide deacetylase family protein n=1 Tax=Clostridium taeniosporum TaxID=394958 RepID=UPI003B839130